MILRIALFALMAVGLGGFGTVAWISTRPPHHAPEAPPAKMKILVAAHPIRAGSLLKPEDLVAREMLKSAVPAGATEDSPAAIGALYGAMVRRSLMAEEPVLPGEIMRPGDHGFLAAVLGPDMRAVTVGVDAVSGSAGLIWPGDRVDLILTQAIEDNTVPLARRSAAETVLTGARVIAIDQHLVQGAGPEQGEPKAARTVTLEVTPKQAERVAVAVKLGHLALVVRSADHPADTAAGDPSTVTWAGEVSPALEQTRQDRTGSSTVRVFQGAADGKDFHF